MPGEGRTRNPWVEGGNESGRDEKWRAGNVKNGSLILTGDGKLLVLSEVGELILAEANPASYRELARAKVLGDRCWVQPTLANGTIYCRNNAGDLVALAAGK